MNGKAPHGDRPKRAFECVRQGGGTVQKYHKTRLSATVSSLTLYADRSGFLYREPLREVSP